MSDSPESYLQRNGITFVKSSGRNGRELLIACPNCGRDGKCSVNARTWRWQCFVCEESGGEVALKKANGHMYDIADGASQDAERVRDEAFARACMAKAQRTDVERWSEALLKDPEAEGARRYLTEERHISLQTCAELLIGWSPTHPDAKPQGAPQARRRRRKADAESPKAKPHPGGTGTGWITIPSFAKHLADGRPNPTSCACVKLRSVPPAEKAYRRVTGGDSILYAPQGIDPEQTLIIVGGELDAVVLHQIGVRNVVAGTTGEKGWSDIWTKQLESVEDIVVIYDGDSTGKAGAEKLAHILGEHRTRIGTWPAPYNDANDALVGLGPDAFDIFAVQAIVTEARSVLASGVVRIKGDVREKFKSRHKIGGHRGVSFGWPHLDDGLGGCRWAEVTVITGDTGSGKTTFISDLCRRMASPVVGTTSECGDRDAIPTMVCAFESGEYLQIEKWVRQQSTHPPEDLSEEQLDATLDQLEQMPLWILRHWGTFSVEALRNTMVYAARKLGVRFIVLDHLSFMVEEGSDKEREQISKILMVCAEVAREEDIHIVIVAHPHGTGTGKDKDRDNRVIQLGDLKGSTSIKQIAFNVLSVWRSRKSVRDGIVDQQGYGESIVYLLKVRSDYGCEGSVPFSFWFRAARFLDPDESTPLKFPKSKGGPATPHRKHWTDDD